MSRYDGPDDIYLAGMKWRGMEEGGGEMWNFSPESDGRIYGYVMLTQGRGTINISRLGANDDDRIENVIVIFYSKRESDKKNYIVGWYENTVVLRNWRDLEVDYVWGSRQFSFIVPSDKAWLIPSSHRSIEIPTQVKDSDEGVKYPGQANVFFGSGNAKFTNGILSILTKLKTKIESGDFEETIQKQKKSKFHSDPEQRKLIEDRAVKLAKFHLLKVSKMDEIRNVDYLCLGWDVEALKDDIKYRIEVKGTSSSDWSFQMTKNEYTQQWDQNNYWIIIVTNVLCFENSILRLRVCRYNDEDDSFISRKEFCYKFIENDNG